MKIFRAIIKLFKVLLILVALIIIPDALHAAFYWVIPEISCSYYQDKSPQFIADKFNKTSGATQEMAYNLFYNCNNKNSYLFEYYAVEFLKKKGLNPFFIIPIPYKSHRFDISVLANTLADRMQIDRIEITAEDSYELYFKNKIEEKLKTNILQLSDYKTFEATYLFLILFCVLSFLYLKRK